MYPDNIFKIRLVLLLFLSQWVYGNRTGQKEVLHAERFPGRRAGFTRILFEDRKENQTM